jgi:hypothetical protein
MGRIPTAPLPAATLIAGYAVAVQSGSRLLGGLVLLAGGLWCVRIWAARHGSVVALRLATAGFAAFVVSHLLALAIGAWPAVLVVAAAMASATWIYADAHEDSDRGTDADAREDADRDMDAVARERSLGQALSSSG